MRYSTDVKNFVKREKLDFLKKLSFSDTFRVSAAIGGRDCRLDAIELTKGGGYRAKISGSSQFVPLPDNATVTVFKFVEEKKEAKKEEKKDGNTRTAAKS